MTTSEVQDPYVQAQRSELPHGGSVLVLASHCLHLWLRLEDSPAGDEVSGTSRQKANFPCHDMDRVWTQRNENDNLWAKGCFLLYSKILSCLPLAFQKHSRRVPGILTAWWETDQAFPFFALNAGRVVNNSKCGRTCAGCFRQHVCT